ncbi:MAG: hypothetical protein KDC18_06405 [Alphaproteobacteria bacterium]|nr:hypothetical protein [Alphaproteobacteria bacterium]MCB9931627.1 hypothetical protein [Alphaproteobacteria bacterium]
MAFRATLEHLLADLHKLEINTIEKPGLTAQKMPAPLLAIHDIVTAYERFDPTTRSHLEAGVDGDRTAHSLIGRLERVQQHATQKAQAMRDAGDAADQSTRLIYNRIQQNSLTVLGILRRAQEARSGAGPEMDAKTIDGVLRQQAASAPDRRETDTTGPIPDVVYNKPADALWEMDRGKLDSAWNVSQADRAQIRKIWELGTEKVLIQTVIQIEGDVTNRISPGIVNRGNQRDYVLEIHQRGVETSLNMWSSLVGVARDLVGALLRAV